MSAVILAGVIGACSTPVMKGSPGEKPRGMAGDEESGEGERVGADESAGGQQSTPSDEATAPGSGIPEPLVKLVQQAKVDLGSRLKLDISEIELLSSEAVTWPDASLGCPEPGRMYAQSRTQGYRIVLRTGGQVHAYHTRGTARFVLCQPPRADDEGSPD